MRVLFLNTDYPAFLEASYSRLGWFRGFNAQMRRRSGTLFGTADFWSRAFVELGHESWDLHVNNLPMQLAWQRTVEGGLGKYAPLLWHLRPALGNRVCINSSSPFALDMIERQIRHYRPDIVYSYDPSAIDGDALAAMKPLFGSLVAQIAAPMDEGTNWRSFDLVVSSLPNYVQRFQKMGVKSAYLPLSFEPRVASTVAPRERDLPLSFVGSVTRAHGARWAFLNRICERAPLKVFGMVSAQDACETPSPIDRAYQGPAWGRGMYAVLGRSQLTLNSHIDIAEGYANNMRLYEATGMGACLITDRGINLAELFEPGREVLAYNDVDECLELIEHYSNNPAAARKIAEAGQRRCLESHNTVQRARELLRIFEANL